MIQYIEHKRGVSLLVRDQDGIVIDAETRWKVQAPSDELATLQDIL